MLPPAGVTTSVRIEGDETVITETVTEHVAVTHLESDDTGASPIARYLGMGDALISAAADWVERQTPARIRPHLNFLYASASAAYMRAAQMRLWVYQ